MTPTAGLRGGIATHGRPLGGTPTGFAADAVALLALATRLVAADVR